MANKIPEQYRCLGERLKDVWRSVRDNEPLDLFREKYKKITDYFSQVGSDINMDWALVENHVIPGILDVISSRQVAISTFPLIGGHELFKLRLGGLIHRDKIDEISGEIDKLDHYGLIGLRSTGLFYLEGLVRNLKDAGLIEKAFKYIENVRDHYERIRYRGEVKGTETLCCYISGTFLPKMVFPYAVKLLRSTTSDDIEKAIALGYVTLEDKCWGEIGYFKEVKKSGK